MKDRNMLLPLRHEFSSFFQRWRSWTGSCRKRSCSSLWKQSAITPRTWSAAVVERRECLRREASTRPSSPKPLDTLSRGSSRRRCLTCLSRRRRSTLNNSKVRTVNASHARHRDEGEPCPDSFMVGFKHTVDAARGLFPSVQSLRVRGGSN